MGLVLQTQIDPCRYSGEQMYAGDVYFDLKQKRTNKKVISTTNTETLSRRRCGDITRGRCRTGGAISRSHLGLQITCLVVWKTVLDALSAIPNTGALIAASEAVLVEADQKSARYAASVVQ